ncbi:type III-B CRISPR module-associated protein Cmr5 [Nocardiopsis lambiniae]|uniref:CRISPR type III-B/RAMP module-associated protein Cmr5 n=1 Tax=Nocardiopsis lambiniae TaxID=3075539 RepID=A0ABU2M2W7_9ACTN|nr:type III-B CRISPR module-associated protein Cmr5 [Nocardiopsis sp. DSM 44743]MDT0326988.1 type III-B CRISPR module-associated protein Cmr5 [Nocardiopsis sp. DSM 44743]
MSSVQRLDQELSGLALKILGRRVSKDLRTRMRQLPSRLRGGGLAATYAFVLSKADPNPAKELGYAYHQLAVKIAEHVCHRRLLGGNGTVLPPKRFLEALSSATPAQYARACAEVDALATWLSRLADALHEPAPPANTTGGTDGADSDPNTVEGDHG